MEHKCGGKKNHISDRDGQHALAICPLISHHLIAMKRHGKNMSSAVAHGVTGDVQRSKPENSLE